MLWPVSVKAVVFRNDTVLLLHLTVGGWELPGGRLELDEQPTHTITRKVLEETGLPVTPRALIAAAVWEPEPDQPVLLNVFRCTLDDDVEPRLAPGRAIHDTVAWTPLTDLPALQLPPIYRQLIAVARR